MESKYKGIAKTLIDLSHDIVKSMNNTSDGGYLIGNIQKVLWYYSLTKPHMSLDGIDKAEKLVKEVNRDIDKARELFEVINSDPGILTIKECG